MLQALSKGLVRSRDTCIQYKLEKQYKTYYNFYAIPAIRNSLVLTYHHECYRSTLSSVSLSLIFPLQCQEVYQSQFPALTTDNSNDFSFLSGRTFSSLEFSPHLSDRLITSIVETKGFREIGIPLRG